LACCRRLLAQNSIRRLGSSLKLMLDAEERALPVGGLPTAK